MRRWELALILSIACMLQSCLPQPASAPPKIEFTKLPPIGDGSPERTEAIEGRVTGEKPGQTIVLYARSGVWWVQPLAEAPFTPIQPDSSWKNVTHPGSAYAAILVNERYRTPTTLNELPKPGGNVIAVAVADTPQLVKPPAEMLEFSGHRWEIRNSPSNRGGTKNVYDPKNVWTDANGFLHLRIAKSGSEWTSAELTLTRSLGYGTYRFAVQDVANLEPDAVFSIFTWDDAGPPREFDIEVSRWGEVESKNAQFVVQPYYVPANVWRFNLPSGPSAHTIRWESGRLSFETRSKGRVVAEHSFTSGVAKPGNELIHMNLYVFGIKANPLRKGSEVVIESFQYLP